MPEPTASTSEPAGRLRLIAATLSCMADLGLMGSTVREISERAGVTPGLVIHHFGSKEGLMVETYRHLNQLTLDRIAKSLDERQDDFEAALSGAIHALFPDDLSGVHQMRVLVAFWGLVLIDPKFAEVHSSTHKEMRALFVRLAEQHFPSSDNSTDIADAIIALTNGLWLECCMNPGCMRPSKAIAISKEVSRTIITAGRSGGEVPA